MAEDKDTVEVKTIGFDLDWQQYLQVAIQARLAKLTWCFDHVQRVSDLIWPATQLLLIVYCPVMDGQELKELQQMLKGKEAYLYSAILVLDDSLDATDQMPGELQDVVDDLGVGGTYINLPSENEIMGSVRLIIGL